MKEATINTAEDSILIMVVPVLKKSERVSQDAIAGGKISRAMSILSDRIVDVKGSLPFAA